MYQALLLLICLFLCVNGQGLLLEQLARALGSSGSGSGPSLPTINLTEAGGKKREYAALAEVQATKITSQDRILQVRSYTRNYVCLTHEITHVCLIGVMHA